MEPRIHDQLTTAKRHTREHFIGSKATVQWNVYNSTFLKVKVLQQNEHVSLSFKYHFCVYLNSTRSLDVPMFSINTFQDSPGASTSSDQESFGVSMASLNTMTSLKLFLFWHVFLIYVVFRKNVQDFSVSKDKNDLGFITFDLEGDILSCCWNLFVQIDWSRQPISTCINHPHPTPTPLNTRLPVACVYIVFPMVSVPIK